MLQSNEHERIYFIFRMDLLADIEAAIEQKQGDGYFFFSTEFVKNVAITETPTSDTDTEHIWETRAIVLLKLTNWAAEDATLQAQAQAAAEYYSNDAGKVHAFLKLSDAQTKEKTKEQIDQILDA